MTTITFMTWVFHHATREARVLAGSYEDAGIVMHVTAPRKQLNDMQMQ